jgi:hypothetical protein
VTAEADDVRLTAKGWGRGRRGKVELRMNADRHRFWMGEK